MTGCEAGEGGSEVQYEKKKKTQQDQREKKETRFSRHWSKRKSKWSISKVIKVECEQQTEAGGSWRSGADLLAMHLYCKSSAKYRNTETRKRVG